MPQTALGTAMLLAGLLVASSAHTIAQEDIVDTDSAEVTTLVLNEVGGRPEAGRYRDDSLGVEFEFALTDGWADGWAAPPYGVVLEAESGGSLAIGDVDGHLLARPCMVEDDDTYPDEHADIELTPEAVMDHWEANPLLKNEGMVPVSVAGAEGYRLDVRVDLSGLGRRCVDPEVPLWGKDGLGTFSLPDDTRARIILFEAEDKVVALVLDGVGRDAFESALELGMPVIDSLSLSSADATAE